MFPATKYGPDEPIFLDSTGCNKMIMIVTDGATETALNVFQNRNWSPDNRSTCHPYEVILKKQEIFRKISTFSDASVHVHDWKRIG